MTFIEEQEYNIRLLFEDIDDYLKHYNKSISNATFNKIAKDKNISSNLSYTNGLLSKMVKKGLLRRVCRGHYTTPYLFENELYAVVSSIFLYDESSQPIGLISGQALLHKYGYIEQIPYTIEIKSKRSCTDIINFEYLITRDSSYKSDFYKTLKLEPKYAEFFEIILCCEKYSLNYSVKEIVNIYLKYNKLSFQEFQKIILPILINLGGVYKRGLMTKVSAYLTKGA